MPLKNSKIPKAKEKINKFAIIFFSLKKFKYNKRKCIKNGLKMLELYIIAIGIKVLKLSSYVREKGIQYKLDKK